MSGPGLWRGEDMMLCQSYLSQEAAFSFLTVVGKLGIAQFKDLNEDLNSYQRTFVERIRRCNEMERILKYFQREIKDESLVTIKELDEDPEVPAPKEMIDLEITLEKIENELKEINSNWEILRRNLVDLKQMLRTSKITAELLENRTGVMSDVLETVTTTPQTVVKHQNKTKDTFALNVISGIIRSEKMATFERILWYNCRGNVYIHQQQIEEYITDITTGDSVRMSVFVIFLQSDRLVEKVKKLCESFRATIYPFIENAEERKETYTSIETRMKDMTHIIEVTRTQRVTILQRIAENYDCWNVKMLKLKAIYHTMNCFKSENKNFLAEFWIPRQQYDAVNTLMKRQVTDTYTQISFVQEIPCETYPTYYKTNNLTSAFLNLIDAYGIATYKEMSPVPFTVITYPFLFAVMFGDAGHGFILFLMGLWMVWNEKKFIKDKQKGIEIWDIIFGGRYIILLMGLFSIYTGFIYNDAFSKSMNIFGSSWKVIYDDNTIASAKQRQLDANDSRVWTGDPYPFGLDPIWQLSQNKITMHNSYKKKVSVILGFTHMLFGIILSALNHLFYGDIDKLVLDFIPMIVFLVGMFGYLVLLVVVKWSSYTAAESACAPSILIGFINMFLFKYKSDDVCYNKTWYSGQQGFQMFLVFVILISAVTLLIGRPLFLKWKHNKKHQQTKPNPVISFDPQAIMLSGFDANQKSNIDIGSIFSEEYHSFDPQQILQSGTLNVEVSSEKLEKHSDVFQDDKSTSITIDEDKMEEQLEDFQFGDIMINQAIHTIEFCLGCISQTASYLRLWALSLAHSQLSDVMWNMTFRIFLKIPGPVGFLTVFMGFPSWAFGSLGVLIITEGLSAFLHTLRLHWVEFQSKFYDGNGIQFQPFSFSKLDQYSGPS